MLPSMLLMASTCFRRWQVCRPLQLCKTALKLLANHMPAYTYYLTLAAIWPNVPAVPAHLPSELADLGCGPCSIETTTTCKQNAAKGSFACTCIHCWRGKRALIIGTHLHLL